MKKDAFNLDIHDYFFIRTCSANMDLPSSKNTLPSTPQPAVFSDDANIPSSPPSSPPGFPWDYDNAPKVTPQPPPKTAFSVLGKRKALTSIDDNVRPAKKHVSVGMKTEEGSLTQMQISLGQQVQKRCKTCGMEYVPSSTEDRKLHDKYHKQNTEGYDVGKNFVRNADEGAVFDGARKGDVICVVDCRDKPGRKAKAQAMLDVAQRELGAVEIDSHEVLDVEKGRDLRPKYRHYLYVRGTRCIGFLLVETIKEAKEVVAPERPVSAADEDRSVAHKQANNAIAALQKRRKTLSEELRQAEASPIELSETSHPAQLGVSRIWTSSSHRRQNVATALLDAALQQQSDPIVLTADRCKPQATDQSATVRETKAKKGDVSAGKGLVAFSQPTSSGARLARRWFGRIYGWKVYAD